MGMLSMLGSIGFLSNSIPDSAQMLPLCVPQPAPVQSTAPKADSERSWSSSIGFQDISDSPINWTMRLFGSFWMTVGLRSELFIETV